MNSMDEITEVQQLLDPPPGLRSDTAKAARHRLMHAAAAPARRPRRWLPLAVAAAAAATTATAVAVVAVTGSGHPSQPATLTAWTVHRAIDDAVTVTLHQFRDPAGLQQSLAAAGVPAVVQFSPSQCPYPYSAIPANASIIGQAVTRNTHGPGNSAVFTIHPAAIPAGTRLDIVFPSSGSNHITKPTPAAPPQAVPAVSLSPPVGIGERVYHPVAIRLIPASHPQCLKPSPGPSPSP
jgi:hypothetical protein